MDRRPVLTAVLALALGCNNSAMPAGSSNLGARLRALETERPTSIVQTSYSGLSEAARIVVEDAAAWSVLWADLTSGIYPPPELPPVNFQTHRVVAAALGSRPNGGYAIRVDSLVEFEQGSLVFVTSQSPGNRCMVTLAITNPVDVVLVPISREPLTFHDQSIVQHCE